MTSNAQWLLKRQSFLRAREQVLLRMIGSAATDKPSEEEIIEGMTFSRIIRENVQQSRSPSSKTERIALNMESFRLESMELQERRIEQWNKELRLIRNWLSILEAALLALTPEERILADKHYIERKSVDVLSQAPLLEITRSRSTLKRMLNTIIRKVDEVISQEGRGHILPRI